MSRPWRNIWRLSAMVVAMAAVAHAREPAPAALVPGDGAAHPVQQPDPCGSGIGSDAKAIAAWDLVPFQTFRSRLNVGVVAFHIRGIDRVEMRADGGPWVDIRQMTLNPETGVVEYWTTLSSDAFPADRGVRAVQIQAVVYPTVGLPRVLDPIYVNVDLRPDGATGIRHVAMDGDDSTGDGGVGRPYATIGKALAALDSAGQADGGIVYLGPGKHRLGSEVTVATERHWVTIAAEPGQDPADVEIVEGGRINADRLHLERVTLRSAGFSTRGGSDPMIWFDRCIIRGAGRRDQTVFARKSAWAGGIYATDTQIRDVANGLGNTTLLRNVSVQNILSDAFQNAQTVINCRVDGIDKTGTKAHPDVLQWYNKGPLDDVIVYGLVARHAGAQGIAIGNDYPITNVAYVNVLIEMDPSRYVSHLAASVDHLLMWNVSLVNRPLWIRAERFRNASIRCCVFWRVDGARQPLWLECDVRDNHFVTGAPFGSDASVGNPGWVNASEGDYRPRAGSVLLKRVMDPAVPVDVTGRAVGAVAAIGAMQP